MPIDSSTVLWNTPESERAGRPHLLLLHGYGSNEGDLFQLAPRLPRGIVIASLRAPMPLPTGHGYAWFAPFEQTGGLGIDQTTDELAEWIAENVTGTASRIGLLGFSQGGMLGMQVLRRHPSTADTLVLLSSSKYPEADPGDEAMVASPPPVFWGHGTADQVIPESRLTDTAAWLPGHTRLTERVYEGMGHSVSEPELDDVTAFLGTHLLA